MAKNTNAFTHDSDAHGDEKMVKLIMKLGYEGYGLWWAFIEKLRGSTNYHVHRDDLDAVAFSLHYDSEKLGRFVQLCIDIGALGDDQGYIFSPSLLRRMEAYEEAKRTRSEAAKSAWEKKKSKHKNPKKVSKAIAKQLHSIEDAPPIQLNTIQTNTIKDLKKDSGAEERRKIGEYVYLKPDTAQKYVKEHGKVFLEQCCRRLNAWVGQAAPMPGERETKEFKERKRKAWNAAHTFNAWVFEDVRKTLAKEAMNGEGRPQPKMWEGTR